MRSLNKFETASVSGGEIYSNDPTQWVVQNPDFSNVQSSAYTTATPYGGGSCSGSSGGGATCPTGTYPSCTTSNGGGAGNVAAGNGIVNGSASGSGYGSGTSNGCIPYVPGK